MLEKLGKYRIDGVLGKGAMGTVYKAFDVNIERIVALKTIRSELFSDNENEDLYARFKNEAQASGRLSHPSIVTVYDFGEVDQTTYLAMEFVKGTALNTLLVTGVPTDLDASVSCLGQLLRALDYAHSRGVVHRDIKPANLLITDAALVKITDFGIARIESSTLTQVGSVIGTPSYMAPEQFRGETADGRTDVFAAGVVLYQLLTGGRPFVGSASTVMHQILNEVPADPSTKNPQLGVGFDALMQKALAKKPADRYQSAQAFLDALLAAHAAYKRSQGVSAEVEEDSERTIIAFRAASTQVQASLQANVISHSDQTDLPSSTAGTSINTISPWKLEILPELQTLLSLQVGPIAKLLLKNAAGNVDNIDDLCDKLLAHIPSEKGREQFLEGVSDLRKKLARSTESSIRSGAGEALAMSQAASTELTTGFNVTNPGQAGLQAAASSAPVEMSAEMIANAELKLLTIMGPIAKIIVKRAVNKTRDPQQFYDLLAVNIPTEAQRGGFLREVGVH